MYPGGHSSATQPTQPPTLQALLPLLTHLAARFPPHWLHRALEPLLQPGAARALPLQLPSPPSSRTPSRSPSRPPPAASTPTLVPLRLVDAAEAWSEFEKRVEAADVAPARVELRTLTALWRDHLHRPLAAVLSASPLGDAKQVCVYEVCLWGPAGAEAERETGGHAARCASHAGGHSGEGASAPPPHDGLAGSAIGLVVYAPQLGRQRGGDRGLLRDVRRALRNGRATGTDGVLLVSAAALEYRAGGTAYVRWPMDVREFEERSAARHRCAVFPVDTWTTAGADHVELGRAAPVATLCDRTGGWTGVGPVG